MHRSVPALLFLLLVFGCEQRKDEASVASEGEAAEATAAPPPNEDQPSSLASGSPSAAATATPKTAEADTPLGAVSLPDQSACLRRCIQENQMRAVAPEQIEADCQKTCHTECLAFCRQGQGDRPVDFEDACRADCDKQRDRLADKR